MSSQPEIPDSKSQNHVSQTLRKDDSTSNHAVETEENIALAYGEWKRVLKLAVGSILGLLASLVTLSLLFPAVGQWTFVVAWNMMGKFLTPFIMEFSIAVGGIVLVLIINQWRRFQEGGEWVELPENTDSKRAHDSFLSPETEASSEDLLLKLEAIEGFLRLGQPGQAAKLWNGLPRAFKSHPKALWVEWKLSLMQAQWPRARELAQALQGQKAETSAVEKADAIAQEVAEWFQETQKDGFSAKQCRKLSPARA